MPAKKGNSKSRKASPLWVVPFRWLTLVFVTGFLFSLMAGWISPEIFWPLSIMGLFFPWLLLGIVLLAIFWSYRRSWRVLLPLACILLGWPQLRSFIGLGSSLTVSAEQKALKVLSFNIHSLNHFNHLKADERSSAFLQAVKLDDYTLLAIQELPTSESSRKGLVKGLAEKGFRYEVSNGGKGLSLFSRLPLKEKGRLPFGNRFNGAVFAEVEWQGERIRIYNVHLQSNKVSAVAEELLSEETVRLDERKTWMNIRAMLARFKNKAQLRARQVRELCAHIKSSPHPVIACGDFNDTPQSYTYAQMTSLLKDGFRERGKGLGTTYRGKIPALRIDYLFSDPSLVLLQYDVLPLRVSDHYPVEATFSR
jgi:endonuclease/exonuclease/phosphatase family metal-dependent hydrolase